MSNPIQITDTGINIKTELMEKEKLYHCIFKDKALLVFKDSQDFLNCYEIEEKELVGKIRNCNEPNELEQILERFIQKQQE